MSRVPRSLQPLYPSNMVRVICINSDGTVQVPSEPVTFVQGQVVRVTNSGSVVSCSKAKLAKLFE